MGERAIPVAWRVKKTAGEMGYDEQEPLLKAVYDLIPGGIKVLDKVSVGSSQPPENPKKEKEKKKQRKAHPGRNPLPPHLPREEIGYDLPLEEKSCGHCGSFLRKIGIEAREQRKCNKVSDIMGIYW